MTRREMEAALRIARAHKSAAAEWRAKGDHGMAAIETFADYAIRVALRAANQTSNVAPVDLLPANNETQTRP